MLLPSVLGFALCFVCLAATTWAWFTASVTSAANTIQTANFDVNVEVTPIGTGTVSNVDGVYTLSAGNYKVSGTKTGSAENVYFLINNGGTEPYRKYLDSGDVAYSFTIEVADNTTITLKWGKLPDNTPIDTGSATALLNEDPADEIQQEEEKENQQEEETPSDEQESTDDPENNGEEGGAPDTSTDMSTDGDGNEEQQPDEPSTPTEGEGEQQGGDPIVEGEPSSSNVGDNTGGEPSTGGETGESNVPEDTADTADTTTPTVQSEGGVSADPAPIE